MRRLVAVFALVCFGGCTTTATIARRDGLDNEAAISHSDAGAVYARARNGEIHRIARENISTIDHPGNVAIVIGSSLLGYFAFLMAISAANSNRDEIAFATLAWGAPSALLLLSGLYQYVPSVRAARAFESAAPLPSAAPVPSPP